jgi:cytoskeleton protein RodZ
MDSTATLSLEIHRRRAGVSLEAIAERTKISSRFLRAIECEEFEKLPGGIFDSNYIRQYAAAIGYPEQQILDLYATRVQTSDSTVPPPQPKSSSLLRSVFNRLLGPVAG